jgi:hypothetical protein
VGYSVLEMAAIVERLLRDLGLTRRFSRLVIICGHGSSSLNNPHEAAHDCGACGGGRGGPNARVFAQMANDPRVRQHLRERNLTIPAETVFVGCYHNTCDDSVTWYDLDRLPATHRAEFRWAGEQIDGARQRSAHERCRRLSRLICGCQPMRRCGTWKGAPKTYPRSARSTATPPMRCASWVDVNGHAGCSSIDAPSCSLMIRARTMSSDAF